MQSYDMNRFEDSLSDIIDSSFSMTAAFGEIVSFSMTNCTADIKPAVKEDNEEGPVLSDVPIMLLSAGGWSINMKPSSGDKVLILFLNHSTHEFWKRDKSGEKRRANLSDAVALPIKKRDIIGQGVSIENATGTMKFEITDTDARAVTVSGSFSVLTHTHTVVVGGATLTTSTPTPIPPV
jgi:hypothetical protein